MTERYIVVDTTALATLSKANQLDILLESGRRVVITSVVNEEFEPTNLDRQTFDNWASANSASIEFVSTLNYENQPNRGEKSIIEVVGAYRAAGKTDVLVLSEDTDILDKGVAQQQSVTHTFSER